jgi:hypothetical protein
MAEDALNDTVRNLLWTTYKGDLGSTHEPGYLVFALVLFFLNFTTFIMGTIIWVNIPDQRLRNDITLFSLVATCEIIGVWLYINLAQYFHSMELQILMIIFIAMPCFFAILSGVWVQRDAALRHFQHKDLAIGAIVHVITLSVPELIMISINMQLVLSNDENNNNMAFGPAIVFYVFSSFKILLALSLCYQHLDFKWWSRPNRTGKPAEATSNNQQESNSAYSRNHAGGFAAESKPTVTSFSYRTREFDAAVAWRLSGYEIPARNAFVSPMRSNLYDHHVPSTHMAIVVAANRNFGCTDFGSTDYGCA